MTDEPSRPKVAREADRTLVRVNVKERSAVLTLGAPPLNIFDFELIRAFRSALKVLRQSGTAVALLRSSVPRAFSSGVDVKIHTPGQAPRMLRRFHSLIRAIDSADTVFVALVDGLCLGGGFELALTCDFVVASTESEFGFPEIDLGCFPPVAACLLPRLNPRAASDLVLTGRRFNAQEAHRLGLIHEVRDDPSEGARRLIETLLGKSGHALAQARRGLRLGRRGSFAGALRRTERLYEREIAPSRDATEGVAAFLEKRAPTWRHH